MARTTRRRLLRAGGVVTAGVLGGCVREEAEPTASGAFPSEERVASLTAWERSTACERRRDNVIAVAHVRTNLNGEFDPVRFERLAGDGKTRLRTVTETGGYASCGVETSAAFDRQEVSRGRRPAGHPARVRWVAADESHAPGVKGSSPFRRTV